MIRYIADTHFGHENIMRLCNRPFNSSAEMGACIINNWNSVVKPEDVVYILGDVAFKSISDPTKILKQLNGHKKLVRGNHDGKNLKNPVFRACFEEIDKMMTVDDNGRMVVLCHYPLMEWEGYFRGSWHVFGHVHNNTKNPCFQYILNEDRALNAGVDITGFKPVTLDELNSLNIAFKNKFRK